MLIRNAKASHPLEAHRALLGIIVRAAAPERGLVVASVMPGGLAERAGIRTGEIITALNGTPIHETARSGR